MGDREALLATLKEKAQFCRTETIRLIAIAKSGHYGSVFSAAEIFATLYYHVLRYDPQRPDWADRDRFILSKGHAAVGLYPLLADVGFFEPALLDTYTRLGSPFGDHPDMRKIPGIDFSSGSLGHGLSVGVGMALALYREPARLEKLHGAEGPDPAPGNLVGLPLPLAENGNALLLGFWAGQDRSRLDLVLFLHHGELPLPELDHQVGAGVPQLTVVAFEVLDGEGVGFGNLKRAEGPLTIHIVVRHQPLLAQIRIPLDPARLRADHLEEQAAFPGLLLGAPGFFHGADKLGGFHGLAPAQGPGHHDDGKQAGGSKHAAQRW